MNKKVLSLVLGLVMVLGTFTTVFAAEEAKTEKVEKIVGKDNKIQYIIDKKFVEGYGNGDFGYDKNIKRSEITKLLVFANGNKELSEKLQGAMKLYSDVETSFWANGVITVGSTVPSKANGQAMLNGYPDKSFKPENNVSYAELSKMLVVLVKTDLTADMVKDANAHWAAQWLTWAAQLGILDDVTVANSNAPATRADAFTMVYNALYKMKEFKREAADAKLGIVSDLNSNKIVLNQDDKQEYVITDNTVFIRNAGNGYLYGSDNIIHVSAIKNPQFYLGSLVRVLVNDKNEVTHILELGNPRDLALEESRWDGVADRVVETGYSNVAKLKDIDKVKLNGYVSVELNKKQTKFDTIVFHNGVKEFALNVDKDTRVFVANPANNQMREVKNIDEAISMIGYGSNRAVIPNVYAGYDKNDGYNAAIKGYASEAAYDAKVIVFNVVAKDNWSGDLYRVLADTDTRGYALLENTDGERMERDFFKSVAAFPFNYADKYDVVDISRSNFANEDIVRKIDHSDKVKFPVAEVVKIYNDKKALVIKDEYNYQAVINVKDADIFNAKQYRDLEVGAKVQFLMDDNKVDVSILSILPYDVKVEGSIRNVVNAIHGKTFVGKVIRVDAERNFSTVTMDVYNNIFDTDDNSGYVTFNVSKTEANALTEAVDKYGYATEFVFLVSDRGDWAGKYYASDFRFNDVNKTPVVEKDSEHDKAQAALDKYLADPTDENKEAARDAIEKFGRMTKNREEEAAMMKKLENKEAEVAKAKEEANKDVAMVAAHVTGAEVKIAKDSYTTDKALAAVKAEVEKQLKDVDMNGVTVSYDLVKTDKVAKTAEVKVTFAKKLADDVEKTFTVAEEAE